MALNTGTLDQVYAVFSTDRDHLGKLNDFIMALQGSGNHRINEVVNELVFLRRALKSSPNNRSNIQSILVSLFKKITRAQKSGSSSHAATLKDLRETLLSIS